MLGKLTATGKARSEGTCFQVKPTLLITSVQQIDNYHKPPFPLPPSLAAECGEHNLNRRMKSAP